MAETANEFAFLMEQVRAGDQEAKRILYERYNQPVLCVVRCRLAKSMRRQYDSEDFSQAHGWLPAVILVRPAVGDPVVGISPALMNKFPWSSL